MRRRNSISHILTPLAIGLALFVLYHTWIKQTYVSPAPQIPPLAETPAPSPPLELTIPREEMFQATFVPRDRMIHPGEAPSVALGTLGEELERGNVQQVEAVLHKVLRNQTGKPQFAKYLAALWNNLGVQQERFGGVQLSVKAFQEAVKLDPRNPTALLNLTQAYWELRHPAMTVQFLETVIRAAPEDPFPHLALADLLLDRRQAGSASTHLGEARRLVSGDPSITAYLNKLAAEAEVNVPDNRVAVSAVQPIQPAPVAKARPAEPAQVAVAPAAVKSTRTAVPVRFAPPEESIRQRTPQGIAHFVVQYDGPADVPAWTRTRAILDYAFDEITQKFGHVPWKPITVTLHTTQKFVGAAGSPTWADTLFDQGSGAIQIPVLGAFDDLALYSRIVRHEFVHALLFEYQRGRRHVIPTWLIEGLAIRLAEDPWPDMEEVTLQGTVLPLNSLQGDWKAPSGESAIRAYMESSGATRYLIDRYSVYSVRQVINLLLAGQSLDDAMRLKLSLSYEQFQRQWEQNRATLARHG